VESLDFVNTIYVDLGFSKVVLCSIQTFGYIQSNTVKALLIKLGQSRIAISSFECRKIIIIKQMRNLKL